MALNIYSLSQDELQEFLVKNGEPKFRASQVFTNLQSGVVLDDIIGVPNTVKELLKKEFFCELPKVLEEKVSADGTIKYLLELQDKEVIETVFLKQDYGNTVCISSQVGCKMGCVFCASGKEGFIRNLSTGEMLSQVLLTKKLNGDLKNIVIMGSGEPLDNYEDVLKFLKLVPVGARNISLSTVGIVDKIKEFACEGIQAHLCISLHASNDSVRTKIMPTAKKYKIEDIITAAKFYFEKTGRRVIFEYALIDGINNSPEHAKELSKLCRGFPCHVNLINLNVKEGSSLKSVSLPKAKEFLTILVNNKVSATIRKSRGSDIEGACGMLKERRGSQNGN